MLKILAISMMVIFASSAGASDYLNDQVRQHHEQAKRKQMEIKQRIQHMKQNPQAYYDRRVKDAAGNNKVSFRSGSNGHFYIPAKVDNRDIRFLADTGASGIFLSQMDAKKLGIPTYNLNYNVPHLIADGSRAYAARTMVNHLKVGPISIYRVPVFVGKHQQGTALLGMEFFKRLKKYEVKSGVMTLYK